MDHTILAEHNGKLYICYESTLYNTPELIKYYWPTTCSFHDLASRMGTEAAHACIGQPMKHMGLGVYRHEQCLPIFTLRTTNGAQTLPEFTETETVPEPTQRGRKLPVEWRAGAWYKETVKGWVTA